MATTFISYRRDDAAGYAGRLHEALEERLGHEEVFRDVDTLEPGEDFAAAIATRLAGCRVFLAMIGREWLDARDESGGRRLDQPHDYVRLEIATALSRPDVRVVPLLIEGASMPPPELLPQEIRALARKQAAYLRDDAWEHDVDRLASLISELRPATLIDRRASPATRSTRRRVTIGIVGVALAALAVFAITRVGSRSGDVSNQASKSPGGSATGSRTAPYGVALPPVAEVAHTALIYTVLSATVNPLDTGTSELRVRVRFSNEGRYDANAWDASFRLVLDGQTLAPTSGLNDVVPGHSLKQGIVTFMIPADARKAVLRVIDGNRVAELPLDLTAARRPAEDEQAEAGDALSRATIRNIAGTPRPLVRDGDFSVTVDRGVSRRFVNVLRLRFALRFANAGRYPAGSSDVTLRIEAGDQVQGPLEAPNVVLAGNSNALADVEFEVPSTATRAVLRGTIRGTSGEWPFDVQ
jgi:hypothetical protein